MELFAEIIRHVIQITAFVFGMMLIVEYINVLTSGSWQDELARRRWIQYLIAAILGATPGCLGAFMVVTLYIHRLTSLGALVTAMIATSGDEAFVMLAMVPKDAFIIMGVLIITGIISGIITDFFLKDYSKRNFQKCDALKRNLQEQCNCYPRGEILSQWRNCSLARGILSVTISILIFYFFSGQIGPDEWDWAKITMIIILGIALFIVSTVPDHFLEEHLWEHIAKKHMPRIFLWTLSALFILHILIENLNLEEIVRESSWFVMGIAGFIGLIPESGPHMLFVTMFAKGMIPISILLANSIIQDGHGMLPLLAYSRQDFILVKLINFIIGALIGYSLLIIGY